MKPYLLDTNICIFYLRGLYNVSEKVEAIGRRNCCISEITVGELLYGAACSNHKDKHLKQIDLFINLIAIKPIYPILPTFAEEKARLRKKGLLIDDFDLLIGATALKHDMILVTENVKHLSHIGNLQIENWIER
ncbi:MAG TPA: type II toxin-antitoxin system VapC family toxin [Candidatus Bacteroides pullicola]|uniref:Ribonuclease VapC n=1 Tax=Candidatus Bacteroides pullicola TaxID=2838475 RepID=A0A9D1ZHL3_9BACE|nr:type II toxin-antitoxin system VapC family toxin [Candidatus Bacteroides pullicola]